MDFLRVSTRNTKRGAMEIYPKFIVMKSNDLMTRGKDFYAIWDDEKSLWCTDEQDAVRLIDKELYKYEQEYKESHDGNVYVLPMWDTDSGMITKWHKYCTKDLRENFNPLDEKLIFSNMDVKKRDYASKTLPYPLEKSDTPAYDELMGVLYSPEELAKIEWAIGSIISGDSKKIQKFIVLYGAAGTGKSTVLNIIQQLFEGYYAVFDAKALGSSNNAFALEAFKSNPLVAIQHDGDLSRIEDNTRLNSLVAHEEMTINEKFKGLYSQKFNSFLFMGTNKPVKITDAKSGLLRRLIDVSPTGNKVHHMTYNKLVKQIGFELGGIAYHCLQVYLDDPHRYDNYIPVNMLGASNHFYNYVLDYYYEFKSEDCVTLNAAWEMYNVYCDHAKVPNRLSRMIFQEELKNYFWEYSARERWSDGSRPRNIYRKFRVDRFKDIEDKKNPEPDLINFRKRKSIFDKIAGDYPAQYANDNGTPTKKWANVATTLSDINTEELHYVKVPSNHIVIDFDIPGDDGEKSFERNLAEASKWPPTYAELSKSGAGIHLHYIYDGDVKALRKDYDDHIEVKVFNGNSSLRRKLTKCNDLPISKINSGLPLKGDTKMVNFETFQSEKSIRNLIARNLAKDIHPGTKPSIDFIYKILDDAYNSELTYDVTDLQGAIFAFAANSTHQSDYCTKLVGQMKFKSKDKELEKKDASGEIIFYDVEVFSNLFVVCWKPMGEGKEVIKMINPDSKAIEELLQFKLVGFNNRRYDNHILYARLLGYDNEQLYNLSQKIINGDRNAYFGEAYNLSYTDILDFSSKKQSLKKFEIELGIHHQELRTPWDQPVPKSLWPTVADYCVNDVLATEAVFNARHSDFIAREILAELAGSSVNNTTNSLTTKIIFGNERKPQLVYTDLSKEFPGYEMVVDEKGKPHNMYKGYDVGFGGFVYGDPGMYANVGLIDVQSMHPSTIIILKLLGVYTKNYEDLKNARIAIKHGDFDKVRKMFGGKLTPYLDDEKTAKDLSYALKIALNSVYGLTSASFDNPFRDPRNVNNIVALRGALFMIDLKEAVEAEGYHVVHIKTDSIKIADVDDKIINFCLEFAKKYGYVFEHEATYERLCLVNDAVYIAKDAKDGHWDATGTQFAVPYVFKTLFSHDPIEFRDLCETKSVQKGSLYLGKEGQQPENYEFIGKVGSFCPMAKGAGYHLYRGNEDKYYSVTGTKGFEWMESEMVTSLGLEDSIDISYYEKLCDEAVKTINENGNFEWFVSNRSVTDIPFEVGKVAPVIKKEK